MLPPFEQARDRLAESVRRIRPVHLAAAGIAAFGVALMVIEAALRLLADAFSLALAVGLGLWLAVLWGREFLTLMQAPDDAFPGRFDKPIWGLAVLLVPPIGVPAFWLYRRSGRAEAPAKPHPRPWLRDWS